MPLGSNMKYVISSKNIHASRDDKLSTISNKFADDI